MKLLHQLDFDLSFSDFSDQDFCVQTCQFYVLSYDLIFDWERWIQCNCSQIEFPLLTSLMKSKIYILSGLFSLIYSSLKLNRTTSVSLSIVVHNHFKTQLSLERERNVFFSKNSLRNLDLWNRKLNSLSVLIWPIWLKILKETDKLFLIKKWIFVFLE